MNEERELPSSPEAERVVLGAIMTEPSAYDRVVGIMGVDDFWHAAHRTVYQTILEMEGKAVDLVTVKDRIREKGRLDAAGGSAYISGLLDGVPDSANVEKYARIVAETSLRRRVINECHKLEAAAFRGEPISEIAAQGSVSFGDFSRFRDDGPQPIRAIAKRTMANLERKMQGGEWVTGIKTGLADVDRQTLGLSRGVLSIAAARPTIGKTTFAIGTSFAAAADGYRTLFIELDMSAEQFGARMLAKTSGVPASQIRHGQGITSEQLRNIGQGALAMLEIDDRILFDFRTRDISKVCALAKREARNGGIDMIVVDHLGHLRGGKGERRDLQIADVCSRLIELAGDTQAAVLGLVQLNRESEREKRAPMLSDMRDSGSYEQDARLVMMLDRPNVRDATVPACQLNVSIPKNEGEAGVQSSAHFDLRTQRITQTPQGACSYCNVSVPRERYA